jgi:2-polyprenyl-3-methyl-5-hydroxy-6-metoxy-1,4-benzoquinol methylase
MTSEAANAQPDPKEIGSFAFHVWNYKQGEVVSLMIHLGDRLGLYRALDGAGPVTAAEFAARTGLQERWLLEWLRGQAAAKLLDYHDGDRFELSAVGAEVLANETDSLAFAAGAFGAPTSPDVVDRLADAFRSGIGLSYQDLGASAAHRTERMLGPWARLALVPTVLPALEGVCSKLERGALVADVGCGSGVALLAMAEAYPNSRFHGFDPTQHATTRAREVVEEKGLTNVEIFTKGGEDLPDTSTYDLIITFDCIHDMPHPKKVIGAIRRSIKDDGTWLIKDIRSHPDVRENFKNPLLGMMYGFSVSACMSSALSEPDGAGLGTLGFNPKVAKEMTAECGFSRFVQHDFDDPANLYYEVRP